MSLKCETVELSGGQVETVFSGTTRNAENDGSTEFSGVVKEDGTVKGNYKEKTGEHVELSASTDGTGFSDSPVVGAPQPFFAKTAQQALAGPAKACSPKLLPWAPVG